MKIISHRGNLNGKDPEQENHPSYIQAAIDAGYDVEIDVWFTDGEYYLGHDYPQYKVAPMWLKTMPLWCHAKNREAFRELLSLGVNCFWHQTDRFTLTSRGIPWCYPQNYMENGISVVCCAPTECIIDQNIYGICTDYPFLWKLHLLGSTNDSI